MTQGAGFRIAGNVSRLFVAPSDKVAFLTIDVTIDGKTRKHDLKAFAALVGQVRNLQPGDAVEVTGSLDVEKLTAKDRSDVMIDGRTKWVPSLVIKAVKVDGQGKTKAAPPPAKHAASFDEGDSDLPF